jgi:peroxiredoxin
VRRGVLVTLALGLGLALPGCATSSPQPARDPVDTTPAEPTIMVTAEMGSPHIGDTAPDFELADQNGARVRLSSLRGSVVVLAFVTSWCPFSEAEQPNLRALAQDYQGKNVKVLAVDIREPEDKYRAYVARVAVPFPVLRDESGDVTLSFTPPGAQPAIKKRHDVIVTSNLVIDAKGKIRFFTMVDTARFDAKLVHVRHAVDRLLVEGAT